MVYVSSEDFVAIREQMANDMLEAAKRLARKRFSLPHETTFKGTTLAELRELSTSILSEKMDVWPEYCADTD